MTDEDQHRTGKWRAIAILAGFAALTLPLMPVQAILLRTTVRGARRFPHLYHRFLCRLLGIRLTIEGKIATDRPVLVVANHSTWLDIPVLSAVAPVSFIAKKEVGSWPFVSALARLQRSVFVDRTRRTAVGETTNEMSQRLTQGDALVLFAEGTSTDGNRVLPLRTSLFGAVLPSLGSGAGATGAAVQTCAIVYGHLHGLPLGRAERPLVGWYGDMAMRSHAWSVLKAGPLDVRITIGEPISIGVFRDRKDLSSHVETQLRTSVVRLLRQRSSAQPLVLAQTPSPKRRSAAKPVNASATWT